MNKRRILQLLALIIFSSLLTTLIYFKDLNAQSYHLERLIPLDPTFESEVVKVKVLDESKRIILALTNYPQIFIVNGKDGTFNLVSGGFNIPFGITKVEDIFNALSGEGRYFAWIDAEGKLRIFDVLRNTLETLNLNYKVNPEPISVDISKNGLVIAIGDRLGFLAIYTKATLEVPPIPGFPISFPFFVSENLFFSPPFEFQNVLVKPNGPFILVGGDRGLSSLFDSKGNSLISPLLDGKVLASAISADGKYFALGTDTGKVYFFSRDGFFWVYQSDTDINSLAISYDGKYLVAGTEKTGPQSIDSCIVNSHDGTVNLSCITERRTTTTTIGTTTLTQTTTSTTTILTSTITQTFITTSLSSGTITLTTTITSTYPSTTNTIPGLGGKVIFWDTTSSNPKWIFRTAGTVNKVDISADGERIAAISTDKGVYLFDKNGLIWNFITGGSNLDMDLSDDGKALAVINKFGKLFFFKDNNLLWTEEDNLEKVSLSFKGDFVLYGGRNKLFFSKASGDKIWESRLEGDIRELKLSKDGAFAVVATSSKLFFFNTERRSPQWSYEDISDLEALDISDDGNQLAIIYRKNLAFWSSSTNLFGNPSPDWSLELSSHLNTVKVNSVYEAVVVLKNNNDLPVILTSRSSLQISSNERIFSGYLNRVQLEDGSLFRLDPKTNSGVIPVGKMVILYFDPPKEFKSLPPSGNYRVHVILDGHYINGVPFKQELNLGNINL